MPYRTISIILLVGAALTPFVGYAQNLPSLNQVPQLFQDLLKQGESLRLSIEQSSGVQQTIQSIQGGSANPTDFLQILLGWGRAVQTWFEQTLGVSLIQVIQAMIGFFIWMIGFFIHLIQTYVH